jgi:hypothetical protein
LSLLCEANAPPRRSSKNVPAPAAATSRPVPVRSTVRLLTGFLHDDMAPSCSLAKCTRDERATCISCFTIFSFSYFESVVKLKIITFSPSVIKHSFAVNTLKSLAYYT